MINNKKLKEIRLLRGLTQKQLARMSGITDAAIRNYELGLRSPNKEQLIKIANALKVNPSTLVDFSLTTYDDFFHLFFSLEETLKLRPVVENGNPPMLLSHNDTFNDFLISWDKMRKKHIANEITEDEYKEWKMSVPKGL